MSIMMDQSKNKKKSLTFWLQNIKLYNKSINKILLRHIAVDTAFLHLKYLNSSYSQGACFLDNFKHLALQAYKTLNIF